MTNGNDKANPRTVRPINENIVEVFHHEGGLTKREYFAIHAKADIPLTSQAFLEETLKRPVNTKNFDSYLDAQCEALAIMKVRIADKLINELNK